MLTLYTFSTKDGWLNSARIGNSSRMVDTMLAPGQPRCGKSAMPRNVWLESTSSAFRLLITTSWLATEPFRQQQEERIRSVISYGVDWGEYLGLVDRHRTPSLSWAALNRVAGIQIPKYPERELKKRSVDCRLSSMKL